MPTVAGAVSAQLTSRSARRLVVRVRPASGGRRRARPPSASAAASAAMAGSAVIGASRRSAVVAARQPQHRGAARRAEAHAPRRRSGSPAGSRGSSTSWPAPSANIAVVRALARLARPRPAPSRPPSGSARPRAPPPTPAPPPNTTAAVGTRQRRELVHAHARSRAIAARRRSARRPAPPSRPSSPVTRAHTASAAATPPQNACVCVTARWWSTRLHGRGRRPASPSDDSGVRRDARTGRGAPCSTASMTSRNSPDDDTASTGRPAASRTGRRPRGRPARPPRRRPPGAVERRQPQRVRDVVGGAVAGRDHAASRRGARRLPPSNPSAACSVCAQRLRDLARRRAQRPVSRQVVMPRAATVPQRTTCQAGSVPVIVAADGGTGRVAAAAVPPRLPADRGGDRERRARAGRPACPPSGS